ncbi:hypothetical protein ACFLZ6_02355 [Nanoarchaeota archaeon]
MEEEIKEENKEENYCCKPVDETIKKEKGFWAGLFYGLVPHTGCIAFIIFTVLGVTAASAFIKPLLLNRYFFHMLIGLSLVLATVSATIYLKKHNMLSRDGIKTKRKYLLTLYGTSIGINLLLFLVVFPLATNMASAAPTGAFSVVASSDITLQVDIPCPGHAPLISEELKTINGVRSVKYRFPNYFDVNYDNTLTSKEDMASLTVFSSYPIISSEGEAPQTNSYQPTGCSSCSTCSGACGGTCGG